MRLTGPKIRDLPFQFMPEKGKRDWIIEMDRYWYELLAVSPESSDRSSKTLQRSCTFKILFEGPRL
jgi:hypothetical protein